MRRILLCLVLLIVFPTIFIVVASVLPKRYTSTMGLLVDQTIRTPQVDSLYATMDDLTSFTRARSVQTQMEILTGTDVLLRALERVQRAYPNLMKSDEAPAIAYENLLARLRVDAEKDSDLVRVSVTQPNPELAAALANEIGYAYLDHTQQLAGQTESAALGLINNQISDTEKTLSSLDKEIARLQSETRLVDYGSTTSYGVRVENDMRLKLGETKAELAAVQRELAQNEAELKKLQPVIRGSTTTEMNRLLDSLDNAIADAKSTLQQARQTYLDGHPVLEEQKARLASLEQDRARLKATREGFRTDIPNPIYQALEQAVIQGRSRVRSLTERIGQYEQVVAGLDERLSSLPEKQARIQFLTRQKNVYELGYQQLLQRRAILQSAGVRQSNARIVSNAIVPVFPSFPDLRVFGMLGFAIGLMISIFVIMPKNPRAQIGEAGGEEAGAPLGAADSAQLDSGSRNIVPSDEQDK
jgi:uncharacterized protein involved in exopolysaccharide biosynthesis